MEEKVAEIDYSNVLKRQKQELQKEADKYRSNLRKHKIASWIVIAIGLFLAFSGIVSIYQKDSFNYTESESHMFFFMGIAYVGIGIFYRIFMTLQYNAKFKEIENKILAVNEEQELLDIDSGQYEKRAEVQFKNHQKELKRYYDINLGHLKWVFPVGIGTLIAGVGIIILSIVLFKDTSQKDVVPILIGTASGVLIDFVGAVFIRMYIETIKASTEFHNKMIHSNDNLFANVLVTKITDENLKNETFAEMAKIISRGLSETKESKDNN